MRAYKVWIKGNRFATQRRIFAKVKADAVATFANEHNVQTIACDAMLCKGDI
jgi:hypothetical protein